MILFATPAAAHIAKHIDLPQGQCTFKQFSDGEWYVHVEDDVTNREVWVLAATPPPADTLLQLLFLLDALARQHARINLLITYFGYARQDRAAQGEALSVEVIFNCLRQFSINRCVIVHIHNQAVKQFYPFEQYIPIQFFTDVARNADCIAAPDQGAYALAALIAQASGKELIVIQKFRPAQEQSYVTQVQGDVRNKRVLIVDDLIATGGTIVHAATALKQQGATSIEVAATHGIFSDNAFERIRQSSILKVYITDSLVHHTLPHFVTIFPLSSFVKEIL